MIWISNSFLNDFYWTITLTSRNLTTKVYMIWTKTIENCSFLQLAFFGLWKVKQQPTNRLPLLGRNVIASSFVRYLALVWAESSLFGIGFYLVLLVQRSADVRAEGT